jgi:hypothetical protein
MQIPRRCPIYALAIKTQTPTRRGQDIGLICKPILIKIYALARTKPSGGCKKIFSWVDGPNIEPLQHGLSLLAPMCRFSLCSLSIFSNNTTMALARWNSNRSLKGKQSSLMEYKQSKSCRSAMSCMITDDNDDVSCLSAHYQNNIACQDMTATVLNSDEEWLRFKQAMQKTPVRSNAAVLQHMHSAVLQNMQAESIMKSRAEHQNRQNKGNRSKPEEPSEICGAAEVPSCKESSENIAERARTQSGDEDERPWYHRGSTAHMLNGDLRHPVKLPCTTPGRYSSEKNPEKPGELICEFGPRPPRIPTRRWTFSTSPSPPDLVSSPKPSGRSSITSLSSRRSSITSVSSLEAAVRSVMSSFDDDSNSKGELLEDFGTRPARKRPSSKSVWYEFGGNSNPSPGSSKIHNDEAIMPVLTLHNSRAA